MGLGAAWNKQESLAYGILFPPLNERLLRLEEAIQIIKKMWSDEDSSTFVGNYYHIENAYCNPKPIQKPCPPIMIGGGGERSTLKVVAKYADACNLSGSPETIKRKLTVLKEHCKTVGRDYDSILKTSLNHVVINDDIETIEKHKQKMIKEATEMLDGSKDVPIIYETSRYLLRHEAEVKKAQAIYGTSEQVLKQISLLETAGIQYFIVNLEPSMEFDALNTFSNKIIKKLT